MTVNPPGEDLFAASFGTIKQDGDADASDFRRAPPYLFHRLGAAKEYFFRRQEVDRRLARGLFSRFGRHVDVRVLTGVESTPEAIERVAQ